MTMPDEQGRMFGREIAARMGIKPSDWRARVSRGHAPKPDGRVIIKNVSHSFWLASTIDRYLAARARRSSNGKAATVTAPNPSGGDS
jgi:hypothetical protein